MEIRDAHVLITGASSGIGQQLALDLIARGATVTSIERRAIKPTPGWVSLEADIRSEKQVEAAMKKIDRPVDVLINNAGVMRRATLLEHPIDEFDFLMETNVRGSWLVLKYALPLLRPGAVVMQMASRHALSLPVNPSLYGLTKRWAMDLATVFAKTYPQFRVKILCPGPVDTSLAREGVTDAELATKKKMMCSVGDISSRIIELLVRDEKSRLLFDARTHAYFLE